MPVKSKGMKSSQIFIVIACFLFASCNRDENNIEYTLFQATGDISTTLSQFKNSLGPLNTTTGAPSGRREISWDGVADSLLDRPLPFNFFNQQGTNVSPSFQRGLVYDEGAFEVSATKFSHVNSEAAGEFSAFSGNKVFANISNDLWPIGFQLAGQTTPAFVRSFGIIFSDVDLSNSTSLEFFEGPKSLGKFFIPAHDAASSFSFFGISFQNHQITTIRISHQGNLSSGQKDISQGGSADLVVMDDIIYSEPTKQKD